MNRTSSVHRFLSTIAALLVLALSSNSSFSQNIVDPQKQLAVDVAKNELQVESSGEPPLEVQTPQVKAASEPPPQAVTSSPAESGYTLSKVGKFVKGDQKFKLALAQTPAKDLVSGDFIITVVDLDDDAKPEFIVQGAQGTCGLDGCMTIVLKRKDAAWVKVFEQNVVPSEYIGITNEKSGEYHLLASVDNMKRIIVANAPGTPMHGKQMVYVIGSSTADTQSASRMTPAAEGKSESKTSSGDHTLKSNDVIGIKIGMSVAEVKTLLSNKFPSSSNFPINFGSYGKQWIGQYVSLPAAMTKNNNVFNKKADEVVIVDFSNPPSKEEVLAVAKYQSYPKDKTPSLLATETGLMEKYGQWDKREEKGGTNYYFWGSSPQTGISCISLELIDPSFRLKDLVRGDSSLAVICQSTGAWGQCTKRVRKIGSINSSLKECGVQAAAYVNFTSKGSKDVSPVIEIATFVADLSRLFDNEVAFTELARKYEKDKNQKSIKSGGTPNL